MIVLDADSILSADTLVTLVREMVADPKLGLLQTVPRLCGGHTLFARLQQFAGAVYGPIVARGIAAWQGDDGNYWGHNAIVRVRAFAAACGLPILPGRKPFGGMIMSHDFVEAALLRRAGWSVRMLPTIGGSWEESPPSLLDVASRDRRWAQGNMQHLAVVGSAGLTWPNRAHMWIGVMSYLASPLWLLLIAVGLGVTAHIATVQFEYFTDEVSLFPRWPRFDTERMIALFVVAMATLLAPKILGLLRALITRELIGRVGLVRLVLGVAGETILSALYAPIMMLIQTRQVWEILRGQDSGWTTQSRQRAGPPWRTLLRRHWMHMIAGLGVAAGLMFISLPLLVWMAPALVGLVLALPLSAASGSEFFAKLTRIFGFFWIPEEVTIPTVIRQRDVLERRIGPHDRERHARALAGGRERAPAAFRRGVAAAARCARQAGRHVHDGAREARRRAQRAGGPRLARAARAARRAVRPRSLSHARSPRRRGRAHSGSARTALRLTLATPAAAFRAETAPIRACGATIGAYTPPIVRWGR